MLKWIMRRQFLSLLAALIFWALPAAAHEIPVDATVQMFVKPEGHVLQVLMRMPLKADMDADYPRKGQYVDLARADEALRTAAIVALAENMQFSDDGRKLPDPRVAAVHMALDSDRSFGAYPSALADVNGPRLPDDTTIFWEQGKLDVLFEYPIQSEKSYFSFHASFDRLAEHEVTALQYMAPNGVTRAYETQNDTGMVSLDPSWLNAAGRFVVMGIEHILSGTDHLLFLFCLVIPFRRIRPLIPIVTAFTVAHSITLIGSAYGFAPDVQWFPPLIEMLIAISIVYMALENIVVEQPKRRWIITFFFGLVHGFGFSFVLRNTLQFAGSHVLSSLLSFNIGVEIGQLFMLAIFVPALNLLFRYVVAQRIGSIILSALVAHQAWHWMEDRFEALQQFPWPTITPEGIISTLRWLTVLLVVAAAVWGVSLITKRWERRLEQPAKSPAE